MSEEQRQAAFWKNCEVVWDIDYMWVMNFVRLAQLSSAQENALKVLAIDQLIKEKKEYER